MTGTAKSVYVSFLETHDQESWLRVAKNLLPDIHEVDRQATIVWFGFWPLELQTALEAGRASHDRKTPEQVLDLEGKWNLAEEIDSSVSFLYGARHWPLLKKAILEHAENWTKTKTQTEAQSNQLEDQIRRVCNKTAAAERIEPAILLGICAVGFMILRQVGESALRKVAGRAAAASPHRQSPDAVLRNRSRKSRDGLFGFLKGAGRRYQVVWDEKKVDARFRALHGQDLAMAGATDDRNYRTMDYRRIDGPVPVECRVGSCGYCWVGLLSGRENLTEISDFERERLNYFGYDAVNEANDPRPPIRLACQAQCHGDVTLVVSHWNGELKRRFDHTPKKLDTA